MTCRNVFHRRRNRDLVFYPGSKGWGEPADCPTCVRHEGGVTLRQASIRNTGTCHPDVKGETKAVSRRKGLGTKAGYRGGDACSRDERTGNRRSASAFISSDRHWSYFVRSPMLGFVQRDARLLGAHWRGFPALTDLTDYFRLVLRTSRSTADAPAADAPTADARATRQVDCPPVQTSLGTPVATPHSWPVRAARRAKPVCALQPGDAIRLET